MSNNAAWARNDYNREHVEGGRVALKGVINDDWSASLTYSFQRQHTIGAWDEDPDLAPRTVERFGPEGHLFEAKTLDFHLDGDVGIGDLVFASTYWSLPTRQQNEYSQYIENFGGFFGVKGANEGFTCLNDPVYGTGPYTGCKVPIQYFEYHTNPQRWSNELRLSSKPGTRFHWLGGLYWEKTVDKNSGSTYTMPGLRTNSPAFQYYNAYNGTPPGSSSLPANEIYAYTTRSNYLQTTEFANISFDITDKLNVEAGVVHFHSGFNYYSPYGQFAYVATSPALVTGGSNKWDDKFGINYKFTDKIMAYADFAQGFRDGGSNSGDPAYCYAKGVPQEYVPDTLNNYELGLKTDWLNGRLIWNTAAYLMHWKQLQTIIYDADICAPDSFNANVGNARIYGFESNASYKVNENWSVQGAASYNDSRVVSTQYATFQPEVGERLPYVPYFSWSWNVRYDHPLGAGGLKGYAQFDMAEKGDMWNDLHEAGSNGFPRMLQPSYIISNLRVGLLPEGGHWLSEFYITNLADKNAIVYTNTGNFDLRETVTEPRVFGVRLNYRFGKETNSSSPRIKPNTCYGERCSKSALICARFEWVVGDADPEEVRHIGAEACTISETLFEMRDELRTRHGRAFRTHIVREGDENALRVHGLCGVRCQRPVQIEEVAAFLALKHRAHLCRKHLVDVERCKRYRDCLATEAECERQPLKLVLWTSFCDVDLNLDSEQASRFRYARHLVNAAKDPRGVSLHS